MRKEIAKAKVNYKNIIEIRFAGGNIRAAWQGLKSIVCVNKQADEAKQHTTIKGVLDAELPNAFNCFFESCDFTQNISALKNSLVPLTDFVICKDQVTALLKKTNIRKAAGPDAVCGRTLRYCANQLSEVFSTLFQMCVNHCQLPSIWKSSTIIPIPKTKNLEQLIECRPVALTLLIMKIFEKILKDEIVSLVYDKLDPLQFAYQPGKGVEDAKLLILDRIYKHLEKPKSHVRLLFADFSSAFNKMQPHILIQRLSSYFNLPDQFLLLLLNFLTDRKQQVLVNGALSDVVVSNTSSPQGCVVPPLLFILYTDSCRSHKEGSYLVKFLDDTALLTLLQRSESDHSNALPDFVSWCDENFLDLNVNKTKELDINQKKKKWWTT